MIQHLLSGVYPLVVSFLVILGTMAIKFLFHKDVHLPVYKKKKRLNFYTIKEMKDSFNYQRKSKDRAQAGYRATFPLFLMLSILFVIIFSCWTIYAITIGELRVFRPYFIIIGVLCGIQYILSIFATPYQTSNLPSKNVAVLVPVYNENAETLALAIESIFKQTYPVKEIHIVNDGSNPEIDYSNAKNILLDQNLTEEIWCTWTDQENSGKRSAQMTAFKKIEDIENCIIITMDSDGILADNAVEEGIKPFEDKEVTSVAGLVVSRNVKDNLLARFTEIIFVAFQQLVDRSFMSVFGNVSVNSGGLAFYTYDIVHTAIQNGYDNERFGKANVKFSDDSFLTLFAVLEGKTVSQISSIVFADMPTKLSHHIRQQLRWSRGAFIRGFWRVRYTPMISMVFFRQLFGWFSFFIITCILIQLGGRILLTGQIPPLEFILIPILFGYIQSTRYLIIHREDLSPIDYLWIWLLTPIATLWSIIILRIVRLYAMISCKKTGWGTRDEVEIAVQPKEIQL